MRRRFLELVAGYAAAALFCVYLFRRNTAIPVYISAGLAVFSAAAAVVFSRRKTSLILKAVFTVSLGALICSVVFCARENAMRRTVGALDGAAAERYASVSDFPQDAGNGKSVRVKILDDDGRSLANAVLYYYDKSELSPGDKLRAKIKLSETASDGLYYLSKGIIITGTVEGKITVAEKGGVRLSNLHVYIRSFAHQGTDRLFGEKSYFVRALLFGDKSGFTDGFFTKVSDVGVSHVFAVSGMNLSFIVSVIMLFGRRRKPLYAAAIVGVLAFIAVSGFSPSVVRAGIMQIAALIAFLIGRESESFSSLALSLLVLLALNPYAAADVGLQFSFASVIGILTVGKKLDAYLREKIKFKSRYLEKPGRAVISMAGVTVSAQIATIPLTVIYFKRISVVSVLSNLLIFWAVEAAFVLAVVALLLSALWFWLGYPLAIVTGLLVSYMESCVTLLSKIPYAVLGTGSAAMRVWVTYAYVSAALFYLLRPRRAFWKASAAVLLSLAAALGADAVAGRETFEVKALSVGNGQCFVITLGGKTAVVDCDSRAPGEAGEALSEELKQRNISSVDLMILTSLHTENTCCADELLGSVRIKKLALPFYSGDRDFALALESEARENRTEVVRLTSDRVFKLGGINLCVYMPPSGGDAKGCAAVLAEYRGAAVLILGEFDAESQIYMAATRDIPELCAVAAGKNGADDGTASEILEKYGVKYVIISIGENAYGIPSEAGLQNMAAFGAKILRTDIMGDISLVFRNGHVGIR